MVMLASYSYLGLIGHPRIDAAAKRAIDDVRLRRGWRAAADGHQRSARAARGAHRRVHEARGRVRVLLRLRHEHRHHHRAHGPRRPRAHGQARPRVDRGRVPAVRREVEDVPPQRHGATSRSCSPRRAGEYKTILVVADSVFSMDGDVMDLPATRALCDRYGARLMVDEAHSIGSLGATGPRHRGALRHVRLHRPQDGDAVEVDPVSVGGYLAGDHDLVDYQRHMSRPFIFSAALPPAATAAALEAFDVIEDEPWRVTELHRVHARYSAGLKAQGWDTMDSTTCVVPVLVGDESKTLDLTRVLFDRGVFVCPIVHPAVPARQRPPAHVSHGDAHRRGHRPGAGGIRRGGQGARADLGRAAVDGAWCSFRAVPMPDPATRLRRAVAAVRRRGEMCDDVHGPGMRARRRRANARGRGGRCTTCHPAVSLGRLLALYSLEPDVTEDA